MKWPFALALLMFTAPAMAQGEQRVPLPSGTTTTSLTPSPDVRAKQWLTLVDDKNFSDAYKQMGPAAQGKTAPSAWAQKVGSTREPLGAMSSRDIKSISLSGQSATVQFDSSFAHRVHAVETVQLVSDKGAWSVVNYTVN